MLATAPFTRAAKFAGVLGCPFGKVGLLSSGVAANFQINYAGTQPMVISGGTNAYAVINAPNSPITISGGSTFYGSITGSTITDTGGTSLYFDTSLLSSSSSSATNYTQIGLREVAY